MNTETIRRETLLLREQERAALAEQLLPGLGALPEPEIAKLWLLEAVRRAQEIDQGAANRISADEVHRQAQALLT